MAIEGLPRADTAEADVVAKLLHSPDSIGDVASLVRPSDFTSPALGTLYDAMIRVAARGESITTATVMAQLVDTKRAGVVQEWFDRAGIDSIEDFRGYHGLGVQSDAKIIKEASVIRQLAQIGSDLMTNALERTGDAAMQLAEAERMLGALTLDSTEKKPVHVREIVPKVMDNMSERSKGNKAALGISSGLSDLDLLIGGFKPGQFIVLAGRPSSGKSALAGRFARAAAKQGTTLFVSLEMADDEIVERLMSADSKTPSSALKSGKIDNEIAQKMIWAGERLVQEKLYILDATSLSLMQLQSHCRRMAIKEKLAMVLVDYAQLMDAVDESANRAEQVSGITRGMKKLARELQCPIIALSQVTRGVEVTDRPRLSHLRESGSIEQDADVVLFVWRPHGLSRREAMLAVAKQRNGPLGDVHLVFLSQYVSFELESDEGGLGL